MIAVNLIIHDIYLFFLRSWYPPCPGGVGCVSATPKCHIVHDQKHRGQPRRFHTFSVPILFCSQFVCPVGTLVAPEWRERGSKNKNYVNLSVYEVSTVTPATPCGGFNSFDHPQIVLWTGNCCQCRTPGTPFAPCDNLINVVHVLLMTQDIWFVRFEWVRSGWAIDVRHVRWYGFLRRWLMFPYEMCTLTEADE